MNGNIPWAPLYGYRKGYEICEEEAAIVSRIFREYLEGKSQTEIAQSLNDDMVKTARGKEEWTGSRIGAILKQERYCGDILPNKSYIVDHMTHKTSTNAGEMEQVYIRDHHLAIVPRYVFEEAQRLREHTVSLGHLPLTCPICGKRMEREARGWICECKRFYMPTKVVKEILGQVTESQVATAATPQAEGAAEDGAEGVTEGGADAGTPIIIPASKNNHYGMKRRNANGLLVDSVVKEITFGDHQKKENCTMSIRWDDGDVDTLPTNFYRMGTSLYAKKGSKKKTKQLREVTRKPWETKTKP